jgi:hypothetical protein
VGHFKTQLDLESVTFQASFAIFACRGIFTLQVDSDFTIMGYRYLGDCARLDAIEFYFKIFKGRFQKKCNTLRSMKVSMLDSEA